MTAVYESFAVTALSVGAMRNAEEINLLILCLKHRTVRLQE